MSGSVDQITQPSAQRGLVNLVCGLLRDELSAIEGYALGSGYWNQIACHHGSSVTTFEEVLIPACTVEEVFYADQKKGLVFLGGIVKHHALRSCLQLKARHCR